MYPQQSGLLMPRFTRLYGQFNLDILVRRGPLVQKRFSRFRGEKKGDFQRLDPAMASRFRRSTQTREDEQRREEKGSCFSSSSLGAWPWWSVHHGEV
ncbi:hypothetical protein Taro_040416 [Colocasia esculenta]|uniref:Uncharacterized protein n=1 Tax=Colocasia esculenta TaxID=4460 RepID=A0A843WSZ2_COLES|nr:hypothetical protein [Colocasia esculenta]